MASDLPDQLIGASLKLEGAVPESDGKRHLPDQLIGASLKLDEAQKLSNTAQTSPIS